MSRYHVHAPIKRQRVVQALTGGGTECLDLCRCGLARRMTNRAGEFESSGWRRPEELSPRVLIVAADAAGKPRRILRDIPGGTRG